MLKVKDLLLLLPEDIASKALTNFRTHNFNNPGNFDYKEAYSMSAAINSFHWASTPEGHEFWRNLRNQYSELENKELTTDGKITIKINQET